MDLTISKSNLDTIARRLDAFGWMLVAISAFLQYDMLNQMLPVLLDALTFLEKHGRLPCLLTSQSLLIHAPCSQFDDIVFRVASQHAVLTKQLQSAAPQPRRRLRKIDEMWTVTFLLYDLSVLHPIVELLFDLLMFLLELDHVECFIVALVRQPSRTEPESSLVWKLYKAFYAKGRWIHANPTAKGPSGIQAKVGNLRPDVLFDCVADQDGCVDPRLRARPGVDATFIVHWLNAAAVLYDTNSYDAVVLDRQMAKALRLDPESQNMQEMPVLFSSWQSSLPGIYRGCLDGVRPASRSEGEPFHVYTAVPLNRMQQAQFELCWMILADIHEAVLHLPGWPERCVPEVEEMAKKFAAQHSLDPGAFLGRIKFMSYLAMEKHMPRIMSEMHVALSWGHKPGHTAVQTNFWAGIPGLTVLGNAGCGVVGANVPAAMNLMVGLGALTVENGPVSQVQVEILNLVRQLVENEGMRSWIRDELCFQVREEVGLFSSRRAADDVLLLLDAVVEGRVWTHAASGQPLECMSCQPVEPLLVKDTDGKLHIAPLAGRLALAVENLHSAEAGEREEVPQPSDSVRKSQATKTLKRKSKAKDKPEALEFKVNAFAAPIPPVSMICIGGTAGSVEPVSTTCA